MHYSSKEPNKNYSYSRKSNLPPIPNFRRLRAYAFDPSLSTQLETSIINEIVLEIDWEGTNDNQLQAGPVGEYVEVIDYDPASRCFYEPVDLNDIYILAQDGLAPAEGNPQFHQQMVYAVAMITIKNFEKALGREVMWATNAQNNWDFVPRLRIFPHALRAANAYYSPSKLALLFGYFPATPEIADQHLPGGTVFTCLSHDIIAHETTHAILDGMHSRFTEPVHPDNLAFHEAFSDLVALLQHFTFPAVLRHQIAKTRGDLSSQNLLGQLAQQLGIAIGNYGALRDALGRINPLTKQWEIAQPNPNDYLNHLEPHKRGAILVGTMFDVFIAIYKQRTRDLLRIATDGTGILKEGALHPDLVNRLAKEASKTASSILNMCIRALDYCPPNEVDFGDYLRALITMDYDLVPNDKHGYRIACIQAFKRRGIYPRNVRTLSVDSLRWKKPEEVEFPDDSCVPPQEDLEKFSKEIKDYIARQDAASSRAQIFKNAEKLGAFVHHIIKKHAVQSHNLEEDSLESFTTYNLLKNGWFEKATGLILSPEQAANYDGLRVDEDGFPTFHVHNLQHARRIGPDNGLLDQLILTITQTREIEDQDLGRTVKFRGGATIILDMNDFKIKYVIKRRIDDEQRLKYQLAYQKGLAGQSLKSVYFDAQDSEPFMALHAK